MSALALALALPSIAVVSGIDSAFPAPDVVLPTNARPLVFVNVPDGEPIAIVRVSADGTEVELAVADVGTALRIDPGPLEPGTTLVIDARCPSCGSFPVSWAVGDFVDDAAPAFADGAATDVFVQGFHSGGLCPSAAGYEVDLTLPALDEPAVVVLEGDDGPVHNDGVAPRVHFFIEGGDERTECYRARALDGAGHETAFADELCFELTHELLEEPACCASAGATPFALVALVVLVRVRRRRRCGQGDP